MRPWIAMAAAYALAFQLLLTGIAAAHAVASTDAPGGDLFVICHGAGDSAAGDQGGTGNQLPRSTCVLCTLTSAPCAVLPASHGISFIDAKSVSDVFPWNDARIIRYDSPTGQYQTGPPARDRISG
jgi:hypothetical protein